MSEREPGERPVAPSGGLSSAPIMPVAAVVLIGVIALAGVWQIWPAVLAPVVLARYSGGEKAATWTGAAAAVMLGAVALKGGPGGVEILVGLMAAVGASLAIGRLAPEAAPSVIEEAGMSRDRLTGLATRPFLMHQLGLECARPRRGSVAVILLDLDHFGQVNVADGRPTGDRLLALIGQAVHEALQPGDIAARIASDEIAVLHMGGANRAREIADRLRATIAAVEVVGPAGHTVSVTASAGVAELRKGDDAAGLLDRADDALLAAKRTGRDRVAAEEDARRLRSVA